MVNIGLTWKICDKPDAFDPYRRDEVRAKFTGLAGAVWGQAHAARIVDAIDGLDTEADLMVLTSLLSASPAA